MPYIVYFVCGLFLIFSVVFGLAGYFINKNGRNKTVRCTAFTTAKIVDMQERRLNDVYDIGSGVTYMPVLEYYVNGQCIKVESAVGVMKKRYTVGQEVNIYYNPCDQQEFYIQNDHMQKTISRVFVLVSVLSLILAIAIPLLVIVPK